MKVAPALAIITLALLGLAHVLRLLLRIDIVVGRLPIPLWWSALAVVVFASVASLLFRGSRRPGGDAAPVDQLEVNVGTWDLSQERQFMENLFCQRLSFFIVIFSLVVAGATAADQQWELSALLAVGFIVCVLVWLTIYRNYVKLTWILQRLHKERSHPVAVVGKATKAKGRSALFPVNVLMGVWIPMFCCATLLLGTVLALAGVLCSGK